MVVPPYVPESGDVVWLQFSPQAGHEQAWHRPALVISPASYNSRVGLAICCPLTTALKGYPFEVQVEMDGVPAAILSDQVKSLDWRARQARLKSTVSPEVMAHVRAKLNALLQLG